MEAFTFPVLAGVASTLLTALFTQSHWTSRTKNTIALIAALTLTALGVAIHQVPQIGEFTLFYAGLIYSTGQVVFVAFKPLFVGFSRLTDIPMLKPATPDVLEATVRGHIPTRKERRTARELSAGGDPTA